MKYSDILEKIYKVLCSIQAVLGIIFFLLLVVISMFVWNFYSKIKLEHDKRNNTKSSTDFPTVPAQNEEPTEPNGSQNPIE